MLIVVKYIRLGFQPDIFLLGGIYMIIMFPEGVRFKCNNAGCPCSGLANSPTDFTRVICNGEEIFSIKCPFCGHMQEVPVHQIPKTLIPYIPIREKKHY